MINIFIHIKHKLNFVQKKYARVEFKRSYLKFKVIKFYYGQKEPLKYFFIETFIICSIFQKILK